jgi:hypothetical protein
MNSLQITEEWKQGAGLYVFQGLPSQLMKTVEILPPGYEFSPLIESDAELINSLWKYKDESSIKMVRTMISALPCIGIVESDVDGKPKGRSLVSWCLTYSYGAMGMLYTLEVCPETLFVVFNMLLGSSPTQISRTYSETVNPDLDRSSSMGLRTVCLH